MELLSPSPSPRSPAMEPFAGAQSLQQLFEVDSPFPAGDGIIHVAVGRSPKKTTALLSWTLRRFACKKVVLLHVHRPSPMIPTPLGKLPSSQVKEDLVSVYRIEEREATKKVLLSFLSTCYRAQVEANIIMIENEHIGRGIIDLVVRHAIEKLVIGATPDNCFKVKGSSSIATYTAKNAPPFSEVWFVSKGKHAWSREASENSLFLPPVLAPHEPVVQERLTSASLHDINNDPLPNPECFLPSTFTGSELGDGSSGSVTSTTNSSSANCTNQISLLASSPLTSTTSSSTSPVGNNSKEELEIETLHDRLKRVIREIKRSKKQAFAELVRRHEVEKEIAEACNTVQNCEATYACEIKLREDLEGLLKTCKQQQDGLAYERNEAIRELQNSIRDISLLSKHAEEMARHIDQATEDLKLIQLSIETLKLKRQNIQQQREESTRQPHRWRSSNLTSHPSCNKSVGFAHDPLNIREFSLFDLQTATCGFSESFNILHVGYGCIYKGELLNRSVAIKRLHSDNVQGLLEFQQEVCILSKLRHPHLVNLIGVCSEALCAVYEYLPNGSLYDRLFHRTTNPPLSWKVRARIAAGIASALLFLHSYRPEKIIHSDLKPEKVLLDSEFNCKIVSFGVCQFVPEDTRNNPLHIRNMVPKGSYSYVDPEYQRTGVLTTKSDVYSFGIIVLQLLTGRPPLALANEVRRSIAVGRLSSILDSTAGEWPVDVAKRLADFGLQCTEMNSRDRPELTPEAVRELQQLHLVEERPIPSFFLCPILQEIMHDPHVAADGFTYEGNALRGWLQSGRETSPMTNVELEHLNLTPNHALRFTIQGWLCESSFVVPNHLT